MSLNNISNIYLIEKYFHSKCNFLLQIEIPFKPTRVILQDFTGAPLLVDLAAMRDAVQKLQGDPKKVNPLCPVDLVIDHSIQVDFRRTYQSLTKNQQMELNRKVRIQFLKWGQSVFHNFRIAPFGSGIDHQVNLNIQLKQQWNKGQLLPGQLMKVVINKSKEVDVKCRLNTEVR